MVTKEPSACHLVTVHNIAHQVLSGFKIVVILFVLLDVFGVKGAVALLDV